MTNLTESMIKSAGKHFIGLSGVQETNGQKNAHIFSSFIVDVDGLWILITAGHILRAIQSAINAGSSFDVWRLDDQMASEGNGVAFPVPFDFVLQDWFVLEDQAIGLDYAALHLSDYFIRHLKAGGVEPIEESAWGDYIQEHDFWVLFGIPSETVAYDEETQMAARFAVLPLEETDPPKGLISNSGNKFFAKISDLGNITDIDGMSGGPVFSLKKVGGVWNYHVIGVQSSWYKSQKILAACPIKSFLVELQRILRQQSNNQIDQGQS